VELRVLGAQDAGGQQGGVDCAGLADRQGRHRDTGRHLHDGQQRIHAREHRRLHRHAEYRQVGLGRTHAWQVRCTAGTGDDHLDATGFCFIGILEQQISMRFARNVVYQSKRQQMRQMADSCKYCIVISGVS